MNAALFGRRKNHPFCDRFATDPTGGGRIPSDAMDTAESMSASEIQYIWFKHKSATHLFTDHTARAAVCGRKRSGIDPTRVFNWNGNRKHVFRVRRRRSR